MTEKINTTENTEIKDFILKKGQNPYSDKVFFQKKFEKAEAILSESLLPDDPNFEENLSTSKQIDSISSIGLLIKNTRLERNITQEALAQKLNVEKALIVDLEKNPQSATMAFLVKVFQVLNAKITFDVILQP
jgi:DNA-binding XRE family transcriptional regulator